VNLACLNGVRLMSDDIAMQDVLLKQDSSVESFSTTAGQMLKKARLDAGLHIAALAVSLRVPVKRIEALENGQMDLLPDMVFVRALTSSICQALKIDAQPILDKLPKAALPRLNRDDVAINTPIGAGNANNSSWLLSIFASPLLFCILFLFAAAIGVYFWPKSIAVVTIPVAVASKASADVGVSQAKELQVANESTATSNLTAGAASNAGSNVSVSAPESLNDASALKVVNVASSSLAADNIVTFKASGETWVEVKSMAGVSLFKKLLNAGETAGTSGPLPLTVIVGRADMTQVEVRGKPVDLVSIAKSNVARFEVK
jgi:cytoskeleton protein RodZ